MIKKALSRIAAAAALFTFIGLTTTAHAQGVAASAGAVVNGNYVYTASANAKIRKGVTSGWVYFGGNGWDISGDVQQVTFKMDPDGTKHAIVTSVGQFCNEAHLTYTAANILSSYTCHPDGTSSEGVLITDAVTHAVLFSSTPPAAAKNLVNGKNAVAAMPAELPNGFGRVIFY